MHCLVSDKSLGCTLAHVIVLDGNFCTTATAQALGSVIANVFGEWLYLLGVGAGVCGRYAALIRLHCIVCMH